MRLYPKWMEFVKNVEIASIRSIIVTEAARDSNNYYSLLQGLDSYDSVNPC